jgi:hypothetical protein
MYKSLADAIRDAEAQHVSLARLALETESKDQGRPVSEIRDALKRALDVMRGAVGQGMTGDLYSASGLVGGDAAKLRTGPDGPLADTPFRDILARATRGADRARRSAKDRRRCGRGCAGRRRFDRRGDRRARVALRR